MVQVCGALLIGGALAIIPLGMGGIPLFKLLFFALAALMGATGLCGTRPHGAPTDTVRICRASECGLVPLPVALREDRMVWGFLCAFFTVVFLSPLWSAAPFLSVVGVEPRFEGVIAYVVFLGLALMVWSMVRRGLEQSLLQVVLWSNVGVVLYGLLQLVGKDPFSGWWDAEAFLGRVFSTVGQPNMLGQFLVLTAPLAALMAWRRKGTTAAAGALAANVLVLLATGSRAAMLGAVVGGGIFLWGHCVTLRCEHSEPRRAIRRYGSWLGCCLAPHHDNCSEHRMDSRMANRVVRVFCGVGMLLSVSIVGFFLFFQRFSLPGEWDRSINGRIAIWRDVVSMIRARPMGWGLETTGLLFPRFQRAPLSAYESLTTSIDRAHSKPLDLLLTVGPLGLLSYYTFLLLLFLRCFRICQSRRDPLVLAGMAGLAGVSASLLFGFEGVVVHAFFWLVCGMLLGRVLSPLGRELERGGQKITFIFNVVAYLLPIILYVVLVLLALSLSARLTMQRAERAFQRGDIVAAVQGYDGAARMGPWDRALLVRFLETTLFTREALVKRRHIPSGQKNSQEELLDTAITISLRHLTVLTRDSDPLLPSLSAWHAALRGEREEAITFLNDAKVRAPLSVPRLHIAGKVAELLGDAAMGEAMRAELTRMLPLWWNDARDPRHRILWKENPWLEEFQIPSPRGRG